MLSRSCGKTRENVTQFAHIQLDYSIGFTRSPNVILGDLVYIAVMKHKSHEVHHLLHSDSSFSPIPAAREF